MKWRKRGRIYTEDDMSALGMMPHSQNPVPVELDDRIRIFFACRPQHTISLPVYIDVDKGDLTKIIAAPKTPLLELGGTGAFDEFGLIPTEVVKNGDELWMYYTGWQRGTSYTYALSIGLAVSEDGGRTFRKRYAGPVIDRTKDEPYMTMAPCIHREDGIWHIFYGSGTGFIEEGGRNEPQYVIKYGRSADGIAWTRSGEAVIAPKSADESNTRPTIMKIGGVYHMLFAYRSGSDYRGGRGSYRIGYASSRDLAVWERDDARAGIDVSDDGWDSSIITYPYAKEINGRWLLFYNGNGFGATGIGVAELEEE